jgi:hypothetical protein
MVQLRSFFLSLVGVTALSALAPAQTFPFLARINAAQEVPTNLSPATGLGFVAIDVAALTLTYREVYQNLSSAESAAHIHGLSGPGVNSGVLHVQALGTLKCGVFAMTPAQQGGALAGNMYFNIHSASFGGGEIRGQINLAPDQGTFCYGDGSGTACPCVNNSAVGDNEGCLHAPGMGGRLVGYAGPAPAPSIASDNLVLHALRLPASTFGNGLLCLGGAITRLPVKATCNGQVGLPEPGDLPISVSGGVSPGVYLYQGWFRTNPPICTANLGNFNLTNGVRVAWVP